MIEKRNRRQVFNFSIRFEVPCVQNIDSMSVSKYVVFVDIVVVVSTQNWRNNYGI